MTFLIGGAGYGLLEVLWRGQTHPSMALTGGVCFVMICLLNQKLSHMPLLFRGALCAVFVTATELLVGILVNRILELHVWDYSGARFHLFGQICLEYTCCWFLLCTALSFVTSRIFRKKRS